MAGRSDDVNNVFRASLFRSLIGYGACSGPAPSRSSSSHSLILILPDFPSSAFSLHVVSPSALRALRSFFLHPPSASPPSSWCSEDTHATEHTGERECVETRPGAAVSHYIIVADVRRIELESCHLCTQLAVDMHDA
ncbi:hypothetical protein F2P79_022477 [Pimephales promelas]|nr:hypothetical protein F2P79_022477 [Pimephales promelas]